MPDLASVNETVHAKRERGGRGVYRGWYVAGVTFVSLGAVLGAAQMAFSVFILPLEHEFGWSRTQVNVSLTLGVVSGLLAPLMGRLMDRYGARWVMTVSLGFISVGFLLRAGVSELWQFYLFTVLVFIGTSGATMLPAGRLVSLWFARTRGRMMGIVTAGNNFGGMVAVPLVAGLIGLAGWRWGFGAIGLLMLAIMILVAAVIRDRPKDIEREAGKRWAPAADGVRKATELVGGMTTRQALHTRAFWFVMTGMTLQQFVRTAVVTQLVPHLQQQGFSAGAAAAAISLLSFFGMSSKLIFGRVSESLTARYTYVLIVGLQAAGLVALIFAGGSAFAWAALVVFGLGMGAVGPLSPLLITEMFGMRNFGTLLGLTRIGVIVPTVVGPVMAGLIYDATGEYTLVFLATSASLVASIVSFLLARPPGGASRPTAPARSAG